MERLEQWPQRSSGCCSSMCERLKFICSPFYRVKGCSHEGETFQQQMSQSQAVASACCVKEKTNTLHQQKPACLVYMNQTSCGVVDHRVTNPKMHHSTFPLRQLFCIFMFWSLIMVKRRGHVINTKDSPGLFDWRHQVSTCWNKVWFHPFHCC